MKNRIIFTLLGGVLLFLWQFLSYAFPNLHESAMRYTPTQDTILSAIAASGLQEGMYVIGMPDPASMSDREKGEATMAAYEGKPYGVLNYQKSHSFAMGMNLFRGMSVCMVLSFILFWILSQQKAPSMINSILICIGIGFMAFLSIPYTNFIWFKNPDIWAHLIDAFVPWTILGILGHRFVSKQA